MDRWIWLQMRAPHKVLTTRRPAAWRVATALCACSRTAVWHRRQPPLFLQRHSYGRLHRHGLHLRHQ